MLITALSGGVGGAKLVLGFSRLLNQGELVVVGNTGDDFELFGLHISPDLDILMYTLAGIVDEEKGWGVKGDTFNCLEALSKYYGLEKWFNLGDRDLATHIHRTALLREGYKLSEVEEALGSKLGVCCARIIPMTDDKVETMVKIKDGSIIHFQEYFVKRGCKDTVEEVVYKGSQKARAAKGIVENLRKSNIIVICPSNPIASIGPILSIGEITAALKKTKCPVVAVSPIVHGKPLKGPADKFMECLGLEVSAFGIAKYYEELITHLIIDEADAHLKGRIETMGIDTIIANTVMNNLEDKTRLARIISEIGSES